MTEPRQVNLQELAELVGISEVSLRKMIREHGQGEDPFPVEEYGRNGVAYNFDADKVAAWFARHREAEEAERRARAEDLKQLRFELFGEPVSETRPGLSAAEREKELQAELLALRLGQQRGELVRAAELEAVIADALGRLRKRIGAIPEELVRERGVDRALLGDLRAAVDRALDDCAATLAGMAGEDDHARAA